MSGPGTTSTMVTASTSPGFAPLTNGGPVSGWMRFRLAPATVARVEVRPNGLSNASRVSKITVSPGFADAADLMSGCHLLWQVPRFSSAHGTRTGPLRVTLIRTCLADVAAGDKATRAAAVKAAIFFGPPPARGATG